MSQEAIKKLTDRWIKDSAFRTEIRRDPEATLRKTGEAFTPEEWQAFRKIDWKQTDEELKARANKAFG